jgi:hypothetical protein
MERSQNGSVLQNPTREHQLSHYYSTFKHSDRRKQLRGKVHIGKYSEFFIGGIWELVLSLVTTSKHFTELKHRPCYMDCNTCIYLHICMCCNVCMFIYILYTLHALYGIGFNDGTLGRQLKACMFTHRPRWTSG